MNDDERTMRHVRTWLEASESPRSADRVIDAVLDAIPTTSQEAGGRPARLRARFRAVALAAASVALAAVVLAVLALRPPIGPGSSASPAIASPGPSPTALPGAAASATLLPGVTAVIDMGVDTWSLAVDEQSVWVQVGDVGIQRIDRATNRATSARTYEVPAMTFADGNLWALDVGTGIVQVDPITGDVLNEMPGISGAYIAVDGMTAWVSDVGHSVDRVDLATGEVVATIDVPAGPKELAVYEGAVWVACEGGGVVARIDIATNDVVAEIPAGNRPVNLAVGEGAVWVWNHQEQLVRIDPETNDAVARINGVSYTLGMGVVVGGGSVWASVPRGIGRIDPATNHFTGLIPLGPGDYVDLAWFAGELWASSVDRHLVYRIDAELATEALP